MMPIVGKGADSIFWKLHRAANRSSPRFVSLKWEKSWASDGERIRATRSNWIHRSNPWDKESTRQYDNNRLHDNDKARLGLHATLVLTHNGATCLRVAYKPKITLVVLLTQTTNRMKSNVKRLINKSPQVGYIIKPLPKNVNSNHFHRDIIDHKAASNGTHDQTIDQYITSNYWLINECLSRRW